MAAHAREGTASFRRAALLVAILNLAYFGVEVGVAAVIGSVSLLADSIDFLEDAAVNGLIVVAIGWGARKRARVGFVLAALLLVPTLATAIAALAKLQGGGVPEPVPLTLAGAGALVVNVACAFLLVRHRERHGSLSRAAFLSARNDAVANLAIIAAGLITARFPSIWPDLVVGVGIAVLNLGAAKEVLDAARAERRYDPTDPTRM